RPLRGVLRSGACVGPGAGPCARPPGIQPGPRPMPLIGRRPTGPADRRRGAWAPSFFPPSLFPACSAQATPWASATASPAPALVRHATGAASPVSIPSLSGCRDPHQTIRRYLCRDNNFRPIIRRRRTAPWPFGTPIAFIGCLEGEEAGGADRTRRPPPTD